MSVLIKGMKMPETCADCFALDEYGDYPVCRLTGEQRGYNFRIHENRMDRCPLVEVPPHGDLINKEVLYNKTAEWEAQALAQLDKLNGIPFDEMEKEEYIACRVWSALYQERSAFKFDVFDAPVVIEADGDQDEYSD